MKASVSLPKNGEYDTILRDNPTVGVVAGELKKVVQLAEKLSLEPDASAISTVKRYAQVLESLSKGSP
jgi:hypothetical protein